MSEQATDNTVVVGTLEETIGSLKKAINIERALTLDEHSEFSCTPRYYYVTTSNASPEVRSCNLVEKETGKTVYIQEALHTLTTKGIDTAALYQRLFNVFTLDITGAGESAKILSAEILAEEHPDIFTCEYVSYTHSTTDHPTRGVFISLTRAKAQEYANKLTALTGQHHRVEEAHLVGEHNTEINLCLLVAENTYNVLNQTQQVRAMDEQTEQALIAARHSTRPLTTQEAHALALHIDTLTTTIDRIDTPESTCSHEWQ